MTIQTPKDIRINFDTTLLEGDFVFDSSIQDLESESGIVTSVIISLFTDQRADDDDILPDSNNPDKRGWWGDLISPDVEGDKIGSKLWLLSREKTLETVLIKAKEYTEEALKWMLDDNIVKSVVVESERQGIIGNDRLALGVTITTFEDSVYTVEIPIVIPL